MMLQRKERGATFMRKRNRGKKRAAFYGRDRRGREKERKKRGGQEKEEEKATIRAVFRRRRPKGERTSPACGDRINTKILPPDVIREKKKGGLEQILGRRGGKKQDGKCFQGRAEDSWEKAIRSRQEDQSIPAVIACRKAGKKGKITPESQAPSGKKGGEGKGGKWEAISRKKKGGERECLITRKKKKAPGSRG